MNILNDIHHIVCKDDEKWIAERAEGEVEAEAEAEAEAEGESKEASWQVEKQVAERAEGEVEAEAEAEGESKEASWQVEKQVQNLLSERNKLKNKISKNTHSEMQALHGRDWRWKPIKTPNVEYQFEDEYRDLSNKDFDDQLVSYLKEKVKVTNKMLNLIKGHQDIRDQSFLNKMENEVQADLDRIKNITKGHDYPCKPYFYNRQGCQVCDAQREERERRRRQRKYARHFGIRSSTDNNHEPGY